jgi:hypothetical protein
MTDEQLFLAFWKKVRAEAARLGVDVVTDDLGHYICWGPMRWLFRFDPDRAREEGDNSQVTEAMEKFRASL